MVLLKHAFACYKIENNISWRADFLEMKNEKSYRKVKSMKTDSNKSHENDFNRMEGLKQIQ